MPAHTQESRFRTIRNRVQKDTGISWDGTDTEFLEMLIQFSHTLLKGDERDAFTRYYIDGGTRLSNPETGRPLREDSRFYQHLQSARGQFRVYYMLTMREAHGRN